MGISGPGSVSGMGAAVKYNSHHAGEGLGFNLFFQIGDQAFKLF